MMPSHLQRRAQLKRTAARTLRANATIPERKLWHCLRDKRLLDVRFRRQQPIGPYVVDFYCSAAKLIVELDGSQHGDAEPAQRDCERTRWLENRGYRVLRFWNTDLVDSEYVIGAIAHSVRERLATPTK